MPFWRKLLSEKMKKNNNMLPWSEMPQYWKNIILKRVGEQLMSANGKLSLAEAIHNALLKAEKFKCSHPSYEDMTRPFDA